MEYRYLGNSGLKVSLLSFGNMTTGLEVFKGGKDECNSEIEAHNFELIKTCVDNGITFFDTAELYGLGVSEIILGKNLKQGGWDRDDLSISTKLVPTKGGIQGNSRKRMRVGVKQSLQRLQLENVDILYLHRYDYDVPILEQIKTMNEFIDQDLTYYWGTSEFTSSQLEEIFYLCNKHGLIPPIADQCQYNMFARKIFEVEYAPLFDNYKLGTTIWSPLAAGLLSGKYNDGNIPEGSRYATIPIYKRRYAENIGWRADKGVEMFAGLKQISDDLGCTQSQLALAWAIKNPDVSTAIFGTNDKRQIIENIEAIGVAKKLDNALLEKIEKLLNNRPSPALNWRTFTPREFRR
ncbi:hypothetical protein SteCoe_26446 [Stentor coeruleus]|uniref:NADP-dependent oxidoreductase domain-containing protein n=1 Tax=Stentor coeruleus TaxID=5963 RepID=A0A1R2BCU7_9CILI|nr:hypothetical protein SteCoe_26446 [Stentor coeruleus]